MPNNSRAAQCSKTQIQLGLKRLSGPKVMVECIEVFLDYKITYDVQAYQNYYSAPVAERSIAISLSVCVCVSPSISLEPLDQSSRNFVCRSPVAVAQFLYGGVAIGYVLPVLWMTSCLAAVGHMAMRGYSGVAILGQSLMSMNALLFLSYNKLSKLFKIKSEGHMSSHLITYRNTHTHKACYDTFPGTSE